MTDAGVTDTGRLDTPGIPAGAHSLDPFEDHDLDPAVWQLETVYLARPDGRVLAAAGLAAPDARGAGIEAQPGNLTEFFPSDDVSRLAACLHDPDAERFLETARMQPDGSREACRLAAVPRCTEGHMAVFVYRPGSADTPEGFRRPDAKRFARLATRVLCERSGVVSLLALGTPDGAGLPRDRAARHRDAVLGHLTTFAPQVDAVVGLGPGVFAVVHTEAAEIEAVIAGVRGLREQVQGPTQVVHGTLQAVDVRNVVAADVTRALTCTLRRWASTEFWSLESGTGAVATLFAEALADVRRFSAVVDTHAFDLVFQPVVAIAGTTVAHWEALTRFHAEPDLSPRMRLKSGAELEMLPVFDLAVARQVVATLAGMPKDRGTVLAINLSAPSLRHPDLIQHLLAIVSARGFPPGRLILEIPTDVDGADWDGVRRFVTAARFLGFGVCLDDFSCDGPSLRCLSEIDIDQVKLDGAQFFRDGARRRELIMLRAFVDMAQQLGIATIAKRVDTPDKREQARSFGFDMVQGHLSGAPRNRPRD